MLPRNASLEAEFSDALTNYVQERSRRDGVIREVRGHVIHEGGATGIQRSPTGFEQTTMVAAEAETTMHFDEIESVDVNYVLRKADEIAEQFAKHFSQNIFDTMTEATKRTNQTVDARGMPLTNEHIMEMLSKMQIDFEKSPHGDLTIVTAPQMAPRFRKLEQELNENPELRKKMNDLMDKKRDEFREREINRNLAG